MSDTRPSGAPRALLIDFDGVLRQWRAHDHAVERHFGLPPGTTHGVAFADELIGPAILGRVSDETWRARVAKALRACYPQLDAAEWLAHWSAAAGELDTDVLAVIRECRASGVRVVLVTNGTSRLARDLARLGLEGEFDAVVNSADVGVAKPDDAIFHHALQRAGVGPERAVFVDDAPRNVAAARRLGLRGHHYIDATVLRAALIESGLLTPPKTYRTGAVWLQARPDLSMHRQAAGARA